jgi:SAM-dependent methyltransferase
MARPAAARPPPEIDAFSSSDDHARFLESRAGDLRTRRAFERSLETAGEAFVVPGRCYVCERDVDLAVDYAYAYEVEGRLAPNWRERLVCPSCGLNARMRATAHLVDLLVAPERGSRVYLTEQVTPVYRWARERFRRAQGSEWLGGRVPLGATDAAGIRNEDVTRLTHRASSFDLVVSLDVLEHVPDHRRALAEFARVLAPGGVLFLSCPFRVDLAANLVRAVVRPDGSVEHLEPPEYHGNPIDPEGALAFHHFGWELLADLRGAGFPDARLYLYWSREWGYLGDTLLVLVGRKPGSPPLSRFFRWRRSP